MKKYFFKYFFGILAIALIIILIQSGSLFIQYRRGQKIWQKDIYERCLIMVENNLKNSKFPDLEINGLGLLESMAKDNRISGIMIRDSESKVNFTVGQTPDGRMLASFIPPEEKITEGTEVRSTRLFTVLNSAFNPKIGWYSINKGKTINERYKAFVPKEINANDIIGSIEVAFENNTILTIDILTYSPRTYAYSKQIINPILRSLTIALPLCIIIALLGAWYVSSKNAKDIDSIRIELNELAQGKTDIEIKENKNSELGQITFAIKELDKSLKANKESRNAWLNSISHDLNTPATAMKMIIDGLNDKIYEPDESTLTQLKQENDTLSDRITKVIDYSTLLSKTKINVKTINTDTLEQFIKTICPNIQITSSIKTIKADEELLQRAIKELLQNAKEASPEDKLKCTITKNENYFQISINNKAKLPKSIVSTNLFEPWTRGDASRTEGGIGLGLAIVGAIATLHKGKASLKQKGTEVVATLELNA